MKYFGISEKYGLFQVKDGDFVADRRVDGVSIGGERNLPVAVHRADQIREVELDVHFNATFLGNSDLEKK